MTINPETLVRSGTAWAPVPFVEEITLLTAAEPFGLWDQSDRDAPPFWAFPWAGGQGLARHILDNPGIVAGRRVLDIASGSGLVAIAAAKAGARSVTATDIDPNALAVIGINAAANKVPVGTRNLDLGTCPGPVPAGGGLAGTALADTALAGTALADVVLAADVFYQREMAALTLAFLQGAARSGADVLVADPGRAFRPDGLTSLRSYQVPVLAVLEQTAVKQVTIYSIES